MVAINVLLKDIKIKSNLTTRHNSHTKLIGKGSRDCRSCSTHTGIIRTYGLMMCRRCFREYANDIGFKQYD